MAMLRFGLLLTVLPLLVNAEPAQAAPSPTLSLVPQPASIRYLGGTFRLDRDCHILARGGESHRIAELFNLALLEHLGYSLPIDTVRARGRQYVSFGGRGGRAKFKEGYRLAIHPESVDVIGDGAGLFYATQTLVQLLPTVRASGVSLPALDIEDRPRFGYRGLLLDVGRHYFPVSTIKKVLDLAAQYKINTFQWHLTDDQGWRVEIRRYPKLTAINSRGGELTPGFYTKSQIREIVAYAKARYITIIPEIEMPGHAGAALAAYPELGCTPGTHENVYCPREASFTFLRNVLTEVIALFPGPYLHIGGDEVDKDGWRRSAEAQAIMKRHGLKSEEELQSYFVRRIERFLSARGKRTVGWDEILEGGLAPDAIVMSWRGELGGVEAVRQGHQVIMAPSEYCYFDYNQGDARREPASIGNFLPLETAYRYEPVPQALQGGDRGLILGTQANLWTEYVATPDYLEYMLFPRLLAFAEAAWSPASARSYEHFLERLPRQLVRLDLQHVNYRIPEPEGLEDLYTTSADSALVDLHSLVADGQMSYTLDGSDPTDSSPHYHGPIRIPLPPGQPRRLNLVVTTAAGRHSVVYGASFLKRAYLEASNPAQVQAGLHYAVIDGHFASVQQVSQGAPAATGQTDTLDPQQFHREFNYGIRFDGYLRVPADDFYRFALDSDDGAVLRIDNELVVDNDGNHARRQRAGHIPLRKGLHHLQLAYFQAAGAAALQLDWAGAQGPMRPVAGSLLFH